VLRARALVGLGVLELRSGGYDRQEALAREIVAIHRPLGDSPGLAQALQLAGIFVWTVPGRCAEAHELIAEGADLAQRLGADHLLAAAEHGLGVIELSCGRIAAARARLERSRKLLEAVTDVREGFLPAICLADGIEWDARDRPRLIFTETAVLGHRLGREHAAAFVPANLAWAAWWEGEIDHAMELAAESVGRFGELGWDYGEAFSLNLLGSLERSRGELDAARRHLERSLALRRAMGEGGASASRDKASLSHGT
jgi:hypothetical protein